MLNMIESNAANRIHIVKDQKKQDFIAKAKTKHGNKFNYENTIYIGYHKELTYVCPNHGLQTQKAGDHLRGKFGCPECSKENKNKNSKTTKEWIKESIDVHGNKYDYSVSNYKNKRTKIDIKCPRHNKIFQQYPSIHLQGYGCPDCGIKRMKESKASKLQKQNKSFTNHSTNKKSLDSLLNQFREVHNKKFNYDSVAYRGDSAKIKNYCNTCNEYFEQSPSSHLRGSGCPWCAGKIKDTNMWIKKAKAVHGNKYDYSKTVYKDIKTKVFITCKVHGDFEILPQKHILRDQGCRECGKNKQREVFLKNQEQWISEAKKVHGDKYDYSKVDYIGSVTNVEIICKKHGSFWQAPSKHISRGDGCPSCMLENRVSNFDDVILKVSIVHGDIYSYNSSQINTDGKKIVLTNIKCKKHGYFNQRLDGHLDGVGCPKCSATKGEKSIRLWLEKNNIIFDEQARASAHFNDSLFIQDIERTFYDFLLPKQKVIIEYDGEQHYYPVDFQGRGLNQRLWDNFLMGLERDKLKTELAENSGYNVLRIPFWERDNIENILELIFIKKEDLYSRYSLEQNRFRYEMLFNIGLKDESQWEDYLAQEGEDF